jgi:hypothetical protein
MTNIAFGYDYGTKHQVVVVADMEFPEMLRSSFIALAYGQVPQFGALVNSPLLMMVFKDEDSAQKCFTHFNSWRNASGDGDAIGVGFIEFDNGEFGMCIYQEHESLIEQYISELHRPEVEPTVMSIGHLKIFSEQSKGYQWFKALAKKEKFVLAPGTSEYGPMLDLGIIKQKAHFYAEKNIPENTMENLLMKLKSGRQSEVQRYSPRELRQTAKELQERRCNQLRRFFPVTIERLRLNQEFLKLENKLTEDGYKNWQIFQAACNICLANRVPELFDSAETTSGQANTIPIRILDYLLANFEDLSILLPPMEEFSAERMRQQICADAMETIQYFTAAREVNKKEPKEVQDDLIALGLL